MVTGMIIFDIICSFKTKCDILLPIEQKRDRLEKKAQKEGENVHVALLHKTKALHD